MSCLQTCPSCPKVRVPVPGEGPDWAEIAAVAEAPSKDEDAKGRPFIGRFGKEMDGLYWPLAGLRRSDVYITNAIKCWPRNDNDTSETIRDSCAGYHLRSELARLPNLKLVILMGAAACALVDLNVDMCHGRLRRVNLFGFELDAWIMYHPAMGAHDHTMMQVIMDDFMALRAYLERGEYHEPVDTIPNPMYLRLHHPDEVLATFDGVDEDESIAIDTEYDPLPVGVDPYCLTYTLEPGTGFLIKAEDVPALEALAGCLGALPGAPRRFRRPKRKRRVLMHNCLADLPVVHAMGVHVDPRDVLDTMMLSYNLCTTPQALKVLAYRLAGMEMVEFDDLVTPYAVEYWLAYVEMISQTQWPKPEPYMRMVPEDVVVEDNGRQVKMGKHMVEKLYRPQSPTTKLKRLLTDYHKNPGPKVFKRWGDWDDQEKAPIIAKYGDLPRKSIRMVSDEQALLNYACLHRDSRIETENGWVKIKQLVDQRYTGRVWSMVDERRVLRPVVGWHCVYKGMPIRWMSFDTSMSRSTHRVRYTPDHQIITQRGKVPIEDLRPGDNVFLPFDRLDSVQHSVVVGSLLGDGCLSQRNDGGWAVFRFGNSIKDREYVEWKVSLIGDLASSQYESAALTRFGVSRLLNVGTECHPELEQIRRECYTDRRTVGDWVELSPLALAIAYMDNGTLVDGLYPRLYTFKCTEVEVGRLCSIITKQLKLNCSYGRSHHEDCWWVSFPGCHERVWRMISYFKHALPRKFPSGIGGWSYDLKPQHRGVVNATVQRVFENPVSPGRRSGLTDSYCIDVSESHNFFTPGECVKNCRDSDATKRAEPELHRLRREFRRKYNIL